MKYKFNEIVDRRNTGSVKFDSWMQAGMPEDALPLWVADMDFPTAPQISQRMNELCNFGVFGYSVITDEYYEAIKGWFGRRFGWDVDRQWLITTPGVVYALATAVRTYTEPGEGIVIQQPVYYPFSNVIENNGRKIVNNPLVYKNGAYFMDMDDLEEKLNRDDVKLMILCSPHNPVGRVWTAEELGRVAELCLMYDVTLVCDEIHCDFVYGEHVHTPMALISDAIKEHLIICTAPSKTFNLAGLQVSNIFIPNQKLRRAFKAELKRQGFGGVNMMGMTACQAAYEKGEEWFDQVRKYIEDNIHYLNDFIKTRMPLIHVVETQGTYLVWLDLTDLHLADQHDFIVNRARLWLDSGSMFGESGNNFERINVACPRATLEEALGRLESAYRSIKGNNE